MSRKNKLDNEALTWYKDAIIYELHIKAFCDSNGDGVGDFNGLIPKLDYLQSLGVTAIWLLPFYPSPLRDDGYDIADYYTINPSYGTIEQFKQLLDEAHKRGLKVITELVINHTSNEHLWFQRARKAPKGSPERDFYVWTDDPKQFKDVRIIFQDFEASNWTWDPVAQQYYWHRFFHHQPDLNFDNPVVQDEIFKILDFWCEMGVDGFRLDAVPYLFERENTNCENLPETHVFLKKLRKHVDNTYPATLLLAEANMWPEDSASYFGNGDECHMNYHFPVMPRMYMALQMEDRHPVTDIFDQTPEIPGNCQWAIFLRNHDELTLEMVTDEERDYMYKAYTKDPKARINLGIRHRLAPLMGNNRKKIELLNCLLFSLPGTPVIYYGDEIGMGDNFYLGDRDGVRTPMQWSADRNAGFSQCDAYKLYLPVIADPAYHYESVNVDVQGKDVSSLLWWMRRIIAVRQQYKAFSRGKIRFLHAQNAKILAYTRTFENETMLVVANLSRYTQPVELELGDLHGYTPKEVFSKNKFPAVKQGQPYFLSVGAYDCQWFLMEPAEQEKPLQELKELPLLKLDNWNELGTRSSAEMLNNILPAYLKSARWFGGKSRGMQAIRIIEKAALPLDEGSVALLLIEVSYQSGFPEIYQLPLAFGSEAEAAVLHGQFPKAIVASLQVGNEKGVLYDAAYSVHYQQALFRLMANNKTIAAGNSKLVFSGSEAAKNYSADNKALTSKILSAEQSNTSIAFSDAFFLKLYRKVDWALNPDIEITRFLTQETDFRNVPVYSGAMEWQFGQGNVMLGMMQELVKSNGDAWSLMQDKLKLYFEKAASVDPATLEPLKGSLTEPTAYEDMPAVMKELVDATLAAQVGLLGKRTAEMHLALATKSDLPAFRPEEFSLHYQRSLFSGFQSLVRETFHNQQNCMNQLEGEAREEAEKVLSMKADILDELKRIYGKKLDVVKIRIHGDYHLGQVLFTGSDFIILDFEGEPARSYSERRLKRSAVKDVAGMIRSFHYAAYGSLFLNEELKETEREKQMLFAEQWYHYISGFFMMAYLEAAKGSALIPSEKESMEMLLQTYLLEKAIYELNYELNNRPGWVLIPLRGILSIMNKPVDKESAE